MVVQLATVAVVVGVASVGYHGSLDCRYCLGWVPTYPVIGA